MMDEAITDCKDILGALGWECNGVKIGSFTVDRINHVCTTHDPEECWFRGWGSSFAMRGVCPCNCHKM